MNILTFDIEEWYLYNKFPKGGKEYFLPIINNYLDKLLDDLDFYDIKATFFCLGIMAREYPEVIKKIYNKGHEIGCHSDKHDLLTNLNPDDFFNDSKIAIDSIEQIISSKVVSYRAPAFSITKSNVWTFEILSDLGIHTDSSIFNGKRRRGGFKNFPCNEPFIFELKNGKKINEFVITNKQFNLLKIFYSGGGYFRLLPYPIIKNLFQNSNYNMSYFHIRDFDAYQKRLLTYKYFISYWGVKTAYKKFSYLLKDFEFVSIGEAIKTIEWDKTKVIKLIDLKDEINN